jgi:hypothetical protein
MVFLPMARNQCITLLRRGEYGNRKPERNARNIRQI